MDPLSISASIAGLLTLTGAVTKGVTSLVHGYKDANKDLIALSIELGGLNQSIELVKSALHGLADRPLPSTPEFESLRLCRQTLEELNRLVPKSEERTQLSTAAGEPLQASKPTARLSIKEKFIWVRNAAEIKELTVKIERHKSAIILYLSVHEIENLKTALRQTDNILDHVKFLEKTVNKMQNNSNDTATQSYFGQIHPYKWLRNASDRRHKGTCLWFVQGQHFQDWKSADNGKLWVYGIPGAGKTTLAGLAIATTKMEALENAGSLPEAVLYFFCDYKMHPTVESNIVISTLLLQLGDQSTAALAVLQSLRSNFERAYGAITAVPMERLVSAFSELASHFGQVSIIVDGLDECQDHSKIVQSLVTLNKSASSVRALFFSRDEPDIRKRLVSAGFLDCSVEADNNDIKSYVAAQLKQRTDNNELSIENPELKLKILERLSSGAKGMFRWVECQLDALCELSYDDAIEEALDNLPLGIQETYDRILSRIHAGKEEEFVIRALKWICHSYQPLTLPAICEIIMIPPHRSCKKHRGMFSQHKLLKYCSSLVRYNDSYDTVEIAHYSVREYLQQIPVSSCYGAFRMDKAAHELSLGQTCLRYLLLEDYDLNAHTSSMDHQNLWKARPFRQTAIEQWMLLAAGSGRAGSDRTFLSSDTLALVKNLFESSDSPIFTSFALESYRTFSVGSPGVEKLTLDQIGERISSWRTIHWACILGLPETVDWLVDTAPDSVHYHSSLGAPIHFAAKNPFRIPIDRMECVLRALIGRGADVNSCGHVGRKVLAKYILDKECSATATDLLLDAGLILDSQTLSHIAISHHLPKPYSPLEKITPRNVLESDRSSWLELKSYCAQKDSEVQDESQNTAIWESHKRHSTSEERKSTTLRPRDVEIVLSLLQELNDIDGSDLDGSTPLHDALEKSSLRAPKSIIDTYGDISRQDLTHMLLVRHIAIKDWTICHRILGLIEKFPTNQCGVKDKAIFLACHRQCDTAVFEAILKKTLDFSCTNKDGWSPLHVATRHGTLSQVQKLIQRDPRSVHYISSNLKGYSPLLSARLEASNGRDIALYLIDSGARTDAKCAKGISVFAKACYAGAIDIILRCNPLQPAASTTRIGGNPAQTASQTLRLGLKASIERGNIAMCQKIINEGFSVNSPLDACSCSPLILALRLGNPEVAKFLVKEGADVNIPSCAHHKKSRTPIMFAVRQADSKLIDLLLDHGADVNVSDMLGWTSLRITVEDGRDEVLEKLLRHGAVDPEITPTYRATGLHVACALAPGDVSLRLANTLLKHGVNINARDCDGETPFMKAVRQNNVILCRRLVEIGADPLALDEQNRSALFHAYEAGSVDLVTWILDIAPSVEHCKDMYQCEAAHHAFSSNSVDMHEYSLKTCTEMDFDCARGCGSLLNMASRYGHPSTVKTILEKIDTGFSKRLCDKATHYVRPPLLSAILEGSLECVVVLLDAGADIEVQSQYWETPLIEACKHGRLAIVKILMERGAKASYVNGAGQKISALEACKWQERTREWLEKRLTTRSEQLFDRTITKVFEVTEQLEELDLYSAN